MNNSEIIYKTLSMVNLIGAIAVIIFMINMKIKFEIPKKYSETFFYFLIASCVLAWVQLYTVCFPANVNWLLKSHSSLFILIAFRFCNALKSDSVRKMHPAKKSFFAKKTH